MLPGLFMPLACGLHIFAKEKRPEGRWHLFGLEAEDDGHNRVKHIRVQHGDQLLSVILFSCILYAGTAKVLQHDEKKHGILPVDKIRGLVIIKVIEQLTFEAVGSLRYLISLKESRLAAALSGFFHIIVYLRNERMATIRAA